MFISLVKQPQPCSPYFPAGSLIAGRAHIEGGMGTMRMSLPAVTALHNQRSQPNQPTQEQHSTAQLGNLSMGKLKQIQMLTQIYWRKCMKELADDTLKAA